MPCARRLHWLHGKRLMHLGVEIQAQILAIQTHCVTPASVVVIARAAKNSPDRQAGGKVTQGGKKSRPAVTVRRPVSLQADGLAEVRGRAFRCRREKEWKPEASRLDVGVLHIAGGRCRRIDGSPDPAGTETGEQLWKELAGRGIGRSGGIPKRRLIGLQVPVGRKLDLVLPGLRNLPGLQPVPDGWLRDAERSGCRALAPEIIDEFLRCHALHYSHADNLRNRHADSDSRDTTGFNALPIFPICNFPQKNIGMPIDMSIGTPIIHSMHYAASPLADRNQLRYRAGADEPRTGTTGGIMFKVEKGVQMPPSKTCNVYPFSRMAVGDSFVVPPEIRYKVDAAARSFGIKHGCRFSTRKDGDQVRIWRIA